MKRSERNRKLEGELSPRVATRTTSERVQLQAPTSILERVKKILVTGHTLWIRQSEVYGKQLGGRLLSYAVIKNYIRYVYEFPPP